MSISKQQMQALLERLHRLLLSYQNPQPEVDKNHNIGLQFAASRQVMNNPWFTEKSVKMAIGGIAHALEPSKVEKWLSDYEIPVRNPKNIGVVMAGNVPLVGFHDFLSVLVAGHNLIAKTSSDDNDLLPVIGRIMTDYEPQLKNRIMFTDDRLMGFDAVIATGSNNTSRYFKHYFGKYPHIIRKSRNSLAVLTGTETPDELSGLCRDIFSYYGLGCRNISKLYVPENWDTACIIPHTEKWMDYTDHHKYMNNYVYQQAVFQMHKINYTDTGNLLLVEHPELSSPVSVVYYERYNSIEKVVADIGQLRNEIQCICGNIGQLCDTPMGKSQQPELWDYADGIDTMRFLTSI